MRRTRNEGARYKWYEVRGTLKHEKNERTGKDERTGKTKERREKEARKEVKEVRRWKR